jgi:hypothetical protein
MASRSVHASLSKAAGIELVASDQKCNVMSDLRSCLIASAHRRAASPTYVATACSSTPC